MSLALVNGRVLTENGWTSHDAVLVDAGVIAGVVPVTDPRVQQAQRHDAGGRMIVPGFIDAQVNGGGDVLFNDAPSVESIRRIGAAHARLGTTGFLPTLISSDLDVMRAAIGAVNTALAEGVPGLLGVHLEGPFLSPHRKGVHDAAKFIAPDTAALDLVASVRGGLTMITLAPERCPPGFIAELVRRGVIVSAGHTAATWGEIRAALKEGLRGFTHLFNAMSPLQGREPGAVGAALEDPQSWCGVIVDGAHVHPASLRLAIAIKPRGKMMLVSDAMPPVGGKSTSFVLAGERIECKSGTCRTPGGALAGSALDMAAAVRNSVETLGVSADEAVRMASTYPAAFLKVDRTAGSIAPGKRADLVELGDDFAIRSVWIGGQRLT